MIVAVQIELLAIHFMKRTSQSYEKTLSGFVQTLIEGITINTGVTILRE